MDLVSVMVISRLFLSLVVTICSACTTIKPLETNRLEIQKLTAPAKATVFFFWQSQCPCVARYQTRIERLAERYTNEGVQFIAVSSNSDDSEVTMLQVSKERGFKLPMMKDHDGSIAQTLGAKTTPTVVLTDSKGNIQFRGWIDNEREEGDAERVAYLENALQDFLKAKTVRQSVSPIFGCRITRSLR